MTLRLGHLRLAGVVALLMVVGGGTMRAHDMWIEPSSFLPAMDRTIGLRLRVGQDFLGDPLVRDPQLIDQFIYMDGEARKPVVGRDGGDPAGLIRPTMPGLFVIGYHSKPSPIVLDAQKFNQYLTDEGLDAVAAIRARRGETNAEAREVFVRCAKSLVLAGPAAETQHDRRLGFPLELVAERNPYVMAPEATVPFLLLYNGQPLAGALVVALNKADPKARTSARSDKNGRVQLRLTTGGSWLVKAVHMVAAPENTVSQWASFWASVTFELKAPVVAAGDGAGR